jgi:sugar phosphate isomerase/epimerase
VKLPGELGQEDLAGEQAGRVLPYFLGATERAVALGAPRIYMTPPRGSLDGAAREHFLRSLRRIADLAGELGALLCFESHPDRAIPTVTGALALVRETDHPALRVLIDLSHLLITEEDPEETILSVGSDIGYVHVADNDGSSDQHRPLFEGRLTPSILDTSLDALTRSGYDGPIGIELNASTRQPVTSLVAARDYLASNAARGVLVLG